MLGATLVDWWLCLFYPFGRLIECKLGLGYSWRYFGIDIYSILKHLLTVTVIVAIIERNGILTLFFLASWLIAFLSFRLWILLKIDKFSWNIVGLFSLTSFHPSLVVIIFLTELRWPKRERVFGFRLEGSKQFLSSHHFGSLLLMGKPVWGLLILPNLTVLWRGFPFWFSRGRLDVLVAGEGFEGSELAPTEGEFSFLRPISPQWFLHCEHFFRGSNQCRWEGNWVFPLLLSG